MAIAKRTNAAATPTKGAAAGKPDLKLVGGSAGQMSEAIIQTKTTVLENGTIRGEPVESETREVKVFATAHATTGVKIGYNRNLGNMEMVKFEAFVSMPHYVEEADTAAAQVIDKAKLVLETVMAEFTPPEAVSNVAGDADLQAVSGEVAGEAQAEADGEVTPEYIDGASMEELAALCESNPDLGVTAADYAEVDDLREVLKSVLFEADGGDEAYTQEVLEGASTDELKAIYEAWEMGKWPPGPEKIARKTGIKKILEKQIEAASAAG
jgi:hypothetical protein